MSDVWASGDSYEPYIGRWSALIAVEFIDWLDIPTGKRWVEVGCGTGALTQTVLTRTDPSGVTAIDPSEAYVGWARRRVDDPRVTFRVGELDDLRGTVGDVVVSGLVLNFIPDPAAAVKTMATLVPGGTVAAYVWDYAGRMDLIRLFWDAAVAIDPAAQPLDEGVRFPLCQADRLEAVFAGAGLSDVSCRAIDVPTVFRDFDDYWGPFLGGQGPAPGYAMALDEVRRTALRERIRASLPIASDGSISLIARAWAARGQVSLS